MNADSCWTTTCQTTTLTSFTFNVECSSCASLELRNEIFVRGWRWWESASCAWRSRRHCPWMRTWGRLCRACRTRWSRRPPRRRCDRCLRRCSSSARIALCASATNTQQVRAANAHACVKQSSLQLEWQSVERKPPSKPLMSQNCY